MTDSTSTALHRGREKAYLTEIAKHLAASDPAIETTLDTSNWSGIPTLDFPALVDADHGLTISADWEGARVDGAHAMYLLPFKGDPIALPDGTAPADAEEAATVISEWIAARTR